VKREAVSSASIHCLICIDASTTRSPERMAANMQTVQECSVSKIRDRDAVLGAIVPKILGILSARGQKLHGFGDCCAELNGVTVLSAARIDAHRLVMSVYDGPASEILKVFSVHVTDFPSAMDPKFYRYRSGSVAVLSWRRGKWEDAIMAENAAPLSISEALRQQPRVGFSSRKPSWPGFTE
jgi:hypothetical protein